MQSRETAADTVVSELNRDVGGCKHESMRSVEYSRVRREPRL